MEAEVPKSVKRDKATLLTFGNGNAKLDNILTLSLPAGYSCPGAKDCLARADVDLGTIVDGPDQKFRCFAASQEAVYSNVRKSRWHNFQLLTQAKLAGGVMAMAQLIKDSLPAKFDKVRVHVSGDFFCMEYFQAWIAVAVSMPDKVFYAYTKSLPYWKANQHLIPDNFRLTASEGGKHDAMILTESFTSAKVVFHPDEAGDLPIDHDDSHAYSENRQSFVLLLHGVQKKDSEAAAALRKLKAENITSSYGRGRATLETH